MDERKIAFIICSHQKKIREEITKYIDALKVPEGFQMELIVIEDAKGMAEGYNRAMKKSNAKFKVYMHHDVFLVNRSLLEQTIQIFNENPNIGMLGVIGCKKLPRNAIWWESDDCIGKTLEDNLECLRELNLGEVTGEFEEVQALDGQFLMTQYDIKWREDICQGWHFYDTSQCLEFARAGYATVVVKQEQPWLIHECGMDINTGYDVEQERFLKEYKLQIENRDYVVEEQIGQLINLGEWEEAKKLLEKYKNTAFYNDNMAIFEASLFMAEGKEEEAFACISKGLSYNCRNYELYFMLGNYYREKNKNQAYLCYENAEFYCNNGDKEFLHSVKEEFFETQMIEVKPVSIVVLSYNSLDVTRLCLDSIYQNIPQQAGEIIVIDNGSTDGSAAWLQGLQKTEERNAESRRTPKLKVRCNQVNKGFPGGCNQGILMAESENDIFLLNNDTILPPNAIFYLRMGLYENEKVGAVGSVSNHANNDQMVNEKKSSPEAWYKYGEEHNIPMKYPYEKKAWLMGFAVMFRRTALEKVGYLDERFTPGNYEDNDIGYRFLKEGYTQLLCKNSFIFHFGSLSFRKNQNAFDELLNRNRMKLAEKHGFQVDNYSWVRTDMLSYIQEDKLEKFRILDVGCGLGATIAKAESLYPNSEVVGIEKEIKIAEVGGKLASILVGDIETMELPWEKESFDYILIGNVLEYLTKPAQTLEKLGEILKKSGSIILSVSKTYQSLGKISVIKKEEIEEWVLSSGIFDIEWVDEDNKVDYFLKMKLR